MAKKKKAESPAKQLKKKVKAEITAKQLKILIPLLSKKENEGEFLEKAIVGATEIILLLIIDTNAMNQEFGFAASEISNGNALMEDVKALLGKKRKKADDILEWGDTLTKIDNMAKLRQVNKIVLMKQDNQYFRDLVKNLRKEKLDVEII